MNLSPYERIINYYASVMTAYHWLPADVDAQPLGLLLDVIVLQDKLNNAANEVPIDACF